MNTESKEYKKIVKKIGAPKFNDGDKVKSTMFEGLATIKGHPEYNGFVWMYSFNENRMLRCGQEYLRSAYEYVIYDETGNGSPIAFIESETAKANAIARGENWDYTDIKTFQSWYPEIKPELYLVVSE